MKGAKRAMNGTPLTGPVALGKPWGLGITLKSERRTLKKRLVPPATAGRLRLFEKVE